MTLQPVKQFRSPHGTRVKCVCKFCGVDFLRSPGQAKHGNKHYCSRACYNKSKFGRPANRDWKPGAKACLACGKEFETGGRGRAQKRQNLCSDECKWASRYQRGAKAKEMPVEQAAWLAGFIDGEGCIRITRRGNSYALLLFVANTHTASLERIKEITGVGNILRRRMQSPRHKEVGGWVVSAEGAETVLRQTIAFMVTKQPQALLAITFQSRLRTPAFKADREWQLLAHMESKEFNRRGPAPFSA